VGLKAKVISLVNGLLGLRKSGSQTLIDFGTNAAGSFKIQWSGGGSPASFLITPGAGGFSLLAGNGAALVGSNQFSFTMDSSGLTCSGSVLTMSLGAVLAFPPATAQDVATGNTITVPTNTSTKRLTATAGAATGVILAAGVKDGQELTLVNVHATNSITFAAAGTSNVADGVSSVVAALTCITLVWDATSARWYHAK
jgi:hypothetical protein